MLFRSHQQSDGDSGQPPLPPEPPSAADSAEDAVTKAQELFGSDIVKVEDN